MQIISFKMCLLNKSVRELILNLFNYCTKKKRERKVYIYNK